MTAHVCKKCKNFNAANNRCKRTGKQTAKWKDWCKEREQEWEEWRIEDNN